MVPTRSDPLDRVLGLGKQQLTVSKIIVVLWKFIFMTEYGFPYSHLVLTYQSRSLLHKYNKRMY
jgi:hypothetical protein